MEPKMSKHLLQVSEALTKDPDAVNVAGGNYFCEHKFSLNNISINVAGFGDLVLPVDKNNAEELIKISSKAKYGYKDQTLLDKKVRDTHIIELDKLKVTINDKTMTSIMNKAVKTMKLPEGSIITPHLYNMLIYKPGQFFSAHRDSEKIDGMVATMVVSLPSPHIGGDLVIHQSNKKHVFKSENIYSDKVKCVAFYADCEHSISKVVDGYRIVLTYNLVLKPTDFVPSSAANKVLLDAVKTYFQSYRPESSYFSFYSMERVKKPNLLIYFLDHSYTENNLGWKMLKGVDVKNAADLSAVAKALGMSIYLSLADIDLCYATAHYNSRKLKGTPILEYLVYDQFTLNHWIDSHGDIMDFGDCEFGDSKSVCWNKSTTLCKPYREEFEPYTGNAGNSMEYWYRRAAIVLCPAKTTKAVDLILHPDNFCKNLSELIQTPGNNKKVKDLISEAGEFISASCDRNCKSMMEVAEYSQNPDVAIAIFSNCKKHILNLENGRFLYRLQTQYGVDFCKMLLAEWQKKDPTVMRTYEKKTTIKDFISDFLLQGGELELAKMLLDVETDHFVEYDMKYSSYAKFKEYSTERMNELSKLLEAYMHLDISPPQKLAGHLKSKPMIYETHEVKQLIKRIQPVSKPQFFQFDIDPRFATNAWHFKERLNCDCNRCKVVNNFLDSKTERSKQISGYRSKELKHLADKFQESTLLPNVSFKELRKFYVLIQKHLPEELQETATNKAMSEEACVIELE